MDSNQRKTLLRKRRHRRVRKKVVGTPERQEMLGGGRLLRREHDGRLGNVQRTGLGLLLFILALQEPFAGNRATRGNLLQTRYLAFDNIKLFERLEKCTLGIDQIFMR